jgi:hypothetical protein
MMNVRMWRLKQAISIKDSIETVEELKRDEDDTMNRRRPLGYPEKVVVSSFCSFLSF